MGLIDVGLTCWASEADSLDSADPVEAVKPPLSANVTPLIARDPESWWEVWEGPKT